jgi:two-component system cell cycle sensor histidine kinase/response regulator CckA
MRQAIQSWRILVVDDESTVRDSIRILLQSDGHKVKTVGSGAEALEELDKSSYDFVFTDLNMDGMSGIQLARAIKAKYPRQTIVMITAYTQVFYQQTQDRTLVDFIVGKPFNIRSIRDILGV